MLTMRFKKYESENLIYCKQDGLAIIFVVLYVDSLILASSINLIFKETKQMLSDRFEMTDMVQIKFLWRWRSIKIPRREVVYSTEYSKNILSKFHMKNSKPDKASQDSGLKLSKAMCDGGRKHEETMLNVPIRNELV